MAEHEETKVAAAAAIIGVETGTMTSQKQVGNMKLRQSS